MSENWWNRTIDCRITDGQPVPSCSLKQSSSVLPSYTCNDASIVLKLVHHCFQEALFVFVFVFMFVLMALYPELLSVCSCRIIDSQPVMYWSWCLLVCLMKRYTTWVDTHFVLCCCAVLLMGCCTRYHGCYWLKIFTSILMKNVIEVILVHQALDSTAHQHTAHVSAHTWHH